MSLDLFPGNYVNHLSSIRNQNIYGCLPGRVARHLIGYAKITSVSATSWDIIIPSDDKRQGSDKTRPDTVGMVIPVGACVYRVGMRVLDMRKNRELGTASSGLVGTTGQELKLASALNVDPSAALAATALSAPAFTFASSTVAPGQTTRDPLISTGVITTGSNLTMRVFNCTTADADGAGVTSTVPGGSYVICEVAYLAPADVPTRDAFGGLPSISEA
jgi:hypothetical protein